MGIIGSAQIKHSHMDITYPLLTPPSSTLRPYHSRGCRYDATGLFDGGSCSLGLEFWSSLILSIEYLCLIVNRSGIFYVREFRYVLQRKLYNKKYPDIGVICKDVTVILREVSSSNLGRVTIEENQKLAYMSWIRLGFRWKFPF